LGAALVGIRGSPSFAHTYKGERYDGRMRNLGANHLSMVAEGRIGRSAVIGDTALQRRSREAVRAAALRLVPEMARIKIGTW
jgi:hypothetical protein